MSERVCSRCALSQPLEVFAFKNKAKGLRRTICRDCVRAISREHYLRNRAEIIQRSVVRNKAERVAKRRMVAEMKDRPCVDCGQTFPWYVMEFDHRNPDEKVGNIGNMKNQANGMPTFLAELAKTDVLCANCHRARTYHRGVRPDRSLPETALSVKG